MDHRFSFDAEDAYLAAAAAISALTVIIGEISENKILKLFKGLSVLITFGLSIRRIRLAQPYYIDVSPDDWEVTISGYRFEVKRSKHGRGRYPLARCLVKGEDDIYQECLLDAIQLGDGTVRLDIDKVDQKPRAIRLEIRK